MGVAFRIHVLRQCNRCSKVKCDSPVAVGTRGPSRPPHRTVRAAFPHTAPTSVPDDASLPRCGVCAPAPVPHESGSEPGVCFAGTHFPWPRPFAPPAPAWISPRRSSASPLLWPRPTSCIRTSPATAPRLPDADLGALCHRSDAGSPSFRHAPSARDVLFDLGRATAPRKTALLTLRSAAKASLRPDKTGISRLNHTPHAVAVYASWPSLPPVTQHSLPGGSLCLTWAGLSPADRASLLAHPLPTLQTTSLHRRALGLGAAQVLVEARHDLDEVARAVAIVELMQQDLVPRILAGAGRAGQAEDV